MSDQWQELKETIVELRDSNGTGTQQEVCKFLVNYMGILEKQMQEPCKNTIDRQAVLDIVDSYSESQSNIEDVTQDIISDIVALLSVTPQPKWISVSERLPEEYKTVIASTEYGVYPEARYTKEDGWEWAYESGEDYWEELANVIAWMPLPAPYKIESEE